MSWHLVLNERYDDADTYSGYCERCTADYKGPPEQVAPANMVAQVSELWVSKVRFHGCEMLTMKIWADWSPVLYTKYRVEATAYKPNVSSEEMTALQTKRGGLQFAIPWLLIVAAVVVLGLVIMQWNARSGNWNTSEGGDDDEDFDSGGFDWSQIEKALPWIAVGLVGIMILPELLKPQQR